MECDAGKPGAGIDRGLGNGYSYQSGSGPIRAPSNFSRLDLVVVASDDAWIYECLISASDRSSKFWAVGCSDSGSAYNAAMLRRLSQRAPKLVQGIDAQYLDSAD